MIFAVFCRLHMKKKENKKLVKKLLNLQFKTFNATFNDFTCWCIFYHLPFD